MAIKVKHDGNVTSRIHASAAGRDCPDAGTLSEQGTQFLSMAYLTALRNLVVIHRGSTNLLVADY